MSSCGIAQRFLFALVENWFDPLSPLATHADQDGVRMGSEWNESRR